VAKGFSDVLALENEEDLAGLHQTSRFREILDRLRKK